MKTSDRVRFKRVRGANAALPFRPAVDDEALAVAARIVDDVRQRGFVAAIDHARRLGEIAPNAPARSVLYSAARLRASMNTLEPRERSALRNAARRIADFARAQRRALSDLSLPLRVAGRRIGSAGHRFVPVASAGCYAPGGRFPLPSSVLMTVIAARQAGVQSVWVCSPKPTHATLAAAHVAGADGVVALGGAQAIAAMAFGCGPLPRCDIIVGPGNRYVTAAKFLASRFTGIDMLAGPSELLVIADRSADPETIAADLLGQAEHDTDAVPLLITTHAPLIRQVESAIERQLASLPTAQTARAAMRNAIAIAVGSVDEAVAASDRLAPEHVQILTARARAVAGRLRVFGAAFIGPRSAEVFGDYGAGPNHVLPTGGRARSSSGLWVGTFLHARTTLELATASGSLREDTRTLALMEGLEAHARAAERRG